MTTSQEDVARDQADHVLDAATHGMTEDEYDRWLARPWIARAWIRPWRAVDELKGLAVTGGILWVAGYFELGWHGDGATQMLAIVGLLVIAFAIGHLVDERPSRR